MKKKKVSNKKLILIIVAIVVLLGVVVSAIFLIKNNADNKDDSYLSIQDIEDKNSVETSFNQLMSSEDFQGKTEKDKIDYIESLLSELEKDKLIKKGSINYNETTKIFHFKYICGIPGSISIEKEEAYTNPWLNSVGLTEGISEKPINLSKSKKSTNDNDNPVDSILMYGFDKKSDTERCLDEWTEMCNSKSTIETEILDCPTVSDFRTALLDKEYICIFEHGNYGDFVPDSYVFKVQGEEVTTETDRDPDYNEDLYYERIVSHTDANGETFYLITPKFFEHYYKNKLTDSIVYLISCQGFGDEKTLTYNFADILTEQCGVKAVLGFNETVAQNYAYYIYDCITDLLLKGYTVGEAYNSAIDELGATDYDFLMDRLDGVTNYFERVEWAKVINAKKATNGASFLISGDKSTTLVSAYTVKGIVNDRESGNPISNVKIEVVDNNIDSDEPIEIVTTNDNGEFSFKLPSSSYSLSFHHDDYEYYGTSLTVDNISQTFPRPILLTSKYINIDRYLSQDIETVANEVGDMKRIDSDDGSIEYKNSFLVLKTLPQEKIINFISITTECKYSIFNVYIGEDLNTATESLKSSGWSITNKLDNEYGTYFVKLKKNDYSISLWVSSNQISSISLALDILPNQQYWVIFNEGFRNDRVELSTIDSSLSPDDLYFVWDTALEINDSSKSGKCKQYYLDENGKWVYMREYGRLSDKATNIIASNLDIYDKNGNLIMEKSSSSNINLDSID